VIGGQKQEAGENATAVQVENGNVTINKGISIAQMSEILLELQRLFVAFTADAQETAEKRINKLREEMLDKFSQPEQANPEAFKDPDFQFLYRRAQEYYARDGNEITSDLLVELLAERSKIPKRDRMALILNEATEKVAKLTDEDVAILSLAFLFYQTGGGAVDYETLVRHYKMFAAPFIKDIQPLTSAYTYLESLGCISMDRLTRRDLRDIIFDNYDLLFTSYFDDNELLGLFPDTRTHTDITSVLAYRQKVNFKPFGGNPLGENSGMPEMTSGDFEWRFATLSTRDLKSKLAEFPLNDKQIERVVNFAHGKRMSREAAFAKLSNDVPELKTLQALWSSVDLQRTNLTSVGLVIGHASLSKQSPSFSAPLNTWIA